MVLIFLRLDIADHNRDQYTGDQSHYDAIANLKIIFMLPALFRYSLQQ